MKTSEINFAQIPKIIVNKSTVPIGTSQLTLELLESGIRSNCLNSDLKNIEDLFTVVSMPEFLAEGQAIQNLVRPDRIVIGVPTTTNG